MLYRDIKTRRGYDFLLYFPHELFMNYIYIYIFHVIHIIHKIAFMNKKKEEIDVVTRFRYDLFSLLHYFILFLTQKNPLTYIYVRI